MSNSCGGLAAKLRRRSERADAVMGISIDKLRLRVIFGPERNGG
jgi:hypothetical protein